MVIQEEENNCSGSLDLSVSLVVCSVKLLELCQILARRTAVDVTKTMGAFIMGWLTFPSELYIFSGSC